MMDKTLLPRVEGFFKLKNCIRAEFYCIRSLSPVKANEKKEQAHMRKLLQFILLIVFLTGLTYLYTPPVAALEKTKDAIIVEVEGDPHEHEQYITKYHPEVQVVAVYDQLLTGLALQGEPKQLAKMTTLAFVKAVHPTTVYQIDTGTNGSPAPTVTELEDKLPDLVFPHVMNDTRYTGKGVKIGVIDTGIDYTHPDLEKNYAGGYDLVDLDDDPMETTIEEGKPTLHGSHVAGIIAANGDVQGVAPDASLYAYRALGPGGTGMSIQVIAAMEEALKDGMDIMNLSLGNAINGPDFPTSMAVNRAMELGVLVVIAAGNSGPDNWTVGAPATATKALSVGAAAHTSKLPYLVEPNTEKHIPIQPIQGSPVWDLKKDYPFTQSPQEATGHILLISDKQKNILKHVQQAEQSDVVAILIEKTIEDTERPPIDWTAISFQVPIANISTKQAKSLREVAQTKQIYLETKERTFNPGVASFSSRGPVVANWDLKPDLIAPGTNIVSTVPGGYQALQGTSMAAPHIAGATALLKEAHPDWSNEKIIAALKTTAKQMYNEENEWLDPIVQGTGLAQPKRAIEARTIVYNSSFAIGMPEGAFDDKKIQLKIENTTDDPIRYSFSIPHVQPGISWQLPLTFELQGNEMRTMTVDTRLKQTLLKDNIHQGWLTLNGSTETISLPYVLVHPEASYPKAMGFGISPNAYQPKTWSYQIYVTKDVEQVAVHLYNPDTLMYDRRLLLIDDPAVGMNEGELTADEVGESGFYTALITIQLTDGTWKTEPTPLLIENETYEKTDDESS